MLRYKNAKQNPPHSARLWSGQYDKSASSAVLQDGQYNGKLRQLNCYMGKRGEIWNKSRSTAGNKKAPASCLGYGKGKQAGADTPPRMRASNLKALMLS